jgi:hypothetical protein
MKTLSGDVIWVSRLCACWNKCDGLKFLVSFVERLQTMKNALVNLLLSVDSLLRDGSDMRTYPFAPRATGLSGPASKAVVSCMISSYVTF